MPDGKCVLFFLCLSVVGIQFCDAHICEETICEYNFEIRWARTMTYNLSPSKVYNVALNGTKLNIIRTQSNPPWDENIGQEVDPQKVITADGRPRNVLVINKQFPGPAIEVYEGTQVVVHVTNEMHTGSISIHWHGMRMQDNVWMDGATYITQCPILPGQTFSYQFIAEPVGTHFYHPHFGGLRADGAFGMLIVHASQPQVPYSLLTVSDWFIQEGNTRIIMNKYGPEIGDIGAADHMKYDWGKDYTVDGIETNAVYFQSALINGRGSWDGSPLPFEKFIIGSTNPRHRFRMASQASELTFEVYIDSHILHVMALGGHEIKPIAVDSVIIAPGESIDFEIDTADTQNAGNFWMRVNLLREGTTTRHHGGNTTHLWEDAVQRLYQDVISKHQLAIPVADDIVKGVKAIVQYGDDDNDNPPTTQPKECTSTDSCTLFNCPYQQYSKYHHKSCISMASAVSASSQPTLDKMYGLNDEDYEEVFLNIGYPWGSSINARKFVQPIFPTYSKNFEDGIVSCSDAGCDSDPLAGCVCSHMVTLPYNKTVQLVISNYEPENEWYLPLLTPHPMHLHGQHFAVLAMGYAIQDDETGLWKAPNPDVYCENRMCKQPRWRSGLPVLNTQNPPLVDTVIVPTRGYVVIRFRTTNPGPWMMHCHVLSHFEEGMAVLIQMAEDQYPALPIDFPQCHNFSWSTNDFGTYVKDKKLLHRNDNNKARDDGNNNDAGHRDNNNGKDDDKVDDGTNTNLLDRLWSDDDYAVKLTRGELIILILCSFGAGLLLVSICCCIGKFCCRTKRGKKDSI